MKAANDIQAEEVSSAPENIDKLDLRPGMMVEVLTLSDKLTYVGKVEKYVDGVLTIRETTGQGLPPVIYNQEIKLRCFRGKHTFVLFGKICGSTRWFWKVDRLRNTFVVEKRAFFRQRINLTAEAMCVRRSSSLLYGVGGTGEGPCRVIDISAGGIRIGSQQLYEVGDRLSLINVRVVMEEEPFAFTCRVRRTIPDEGQRTLYGCQFENLPPREQDRLLRAIFIAQRKEIYAQRNRPV